MEFSDGCGGAVVPAILKQCWLSWGVSKVQPAILNSYSRNPCNVRAEYKTTANDRYK